MLNVASPVSKRTLCGLGSDQCRLACRFDLYVLYLVYDVKEP